MTGKEKTLEERIDRLECMLRIHLLDVLTVKEAALFLGLSESRVRHLMSDNAIPYYRNEDGEVHFLKSELCYRKLGDLVMSTEQIKNKAITHCVINPRPITTKKRTVKRTTPQAPSSSR